MADVVVAVLKVLSTIGLILYYWLEAIFLTLVPKRLRYKDVSKETVLITGGGGGIGRLLAIRFAKLGCRVVLWDINLEGCEETQRQVREIGGQAYVYECDVSDCNSIKKRSVQVKQEVGNITILVNNAGIVTGKRFLDCSDKEIVKTFEVNALSHFWMCKAFLPDMISKDHGHLVSIASLAGLSGAVGLTDYCASKFAAVGFDESLKLEIKAGRHDGIKSTLVCPFFINTGMFAGATSGCFKFLEPEFVADEIMAAILTNQEIIIIPKLFYVLYVVKSILPNKVGYLLNEAFGFSNSMEGYVGRSKVR
ncbi:epidermal retinol dehydrogenase 2-like [Tachypleus tridentatus]|uniref:epidermal retinol dehydrogenase 2-like n=1 Tax=Tachypleus tridentatus TaxID=6853 RepID=UPI003FD60E14